MSTFDNREKGYENRFAHELEVDFKIRSKRNKLLGEWAASKLNININNVSDYALEVMNSAVDGVANETVLAKVTQDFSEKNIDISEEEIKHEMDRLLAIVKKEFE